MSPRRSRWVAAGQGAAAAQLKNAYCVDGQDAGGVPVLPPTHLDDRVIDALRLRLDAVLLTGSGDIDLRRFRNEQRHQRLTA